MDEKQRIKEVAEQIAGLLQIVDVTAIALKDDFDLIDKVADSLKEQISFKESASIVFTALGKNYDGLEDGYKLKTINCLKELLKIRYEYGEALKKQKIEKQNHDKILKMFGLLED